MENIFSMLNAQGATIKIRKRQHNTVFWGVAPTGDIHIGYLAYIKLLHALKTKGMKIIIFVADYHAYLDAEKTAFNKLPERSDYYRKTFLRFGFDSHEIIHAKDIYPKASYVKLLFELANFLPVSQMLEYAERTLGHYHGKNYSFGDLIYVATQIIDLEYFGIDLVLCGFDESGIYELGLPIVEKTSNRIVDSIYLPMISGVATEEMHASQNRINKISVDEEIGEIKLKLQKSKRLLDDVQNFILPLYGFNCSASIKEISESLYEICNARL